MAAITTAAIGAGVNAYNVYSNIKQKDQAKKDLNNYERQALTNAYENMPISTIGSDLIKEENARTTSNSIDAVQNIGSRAVFGALPKIQAQNNESNQSARAYLDNQIQKRDYAIAEDNTRLRDIKENRDNQNISALSSQINSANQGIQDGIYGGLSALSSLGRSIGGDKEARQQRKIDNRQVSTVNDGIEAQGVKNVQSSHLPQYYSDFDKKFNQ